MKPRHAFLSIIALSLIALAEPQSATPPDTARTPESIDVFPCEETPTMITDSCPQPVFPASCPDSIDRAKVLVWLYVVEDGSIEKWIIVQAKPEGLGFEQEVAAVIHNWRFVPAMWAGNPCATWISIPFTFVRPAP